MKKQLKLFFIIPLAISFCLQRIVKSESIIDKRLHEQSLQKESVRSSGDSSASANQRHSFPWTFYPPPQLRGSDAPGIIGGPFSPGDNLDLYRQPGRRFSRGDHLLPKLEEWLRQ